MQPMTVTEIASAVKGVWWNPSEQVPVVSAVSTDSRRIVPGSLFLPWVGEKFDGHLFIDAALDAGAAGCLCAKLPQNIREDKFYIKVADTRLALRDLASAYRDRFEIPFVQITGSVGKTTTKEMIAAVLGAKLNVLKTPENFNNDIGTPLTLLGLAPEHEAAVIETGMNHFGEIEYLGAMVRPDIAVISNIGDAHIEYLGSREGILKAKCEIFEHLKADGVAILNGDDALLDTVTLPQRIVRCGQSEHCKTRISDIVDHGVDGITCTVTTPKGVYQLTIPAPGEHMAYSASMAVAVGEELGLSREEIVRGVAAYEPTGSRMRVIRLPGGRVLLDDCYNANPQSMRAAVEVLSNTKAEHKVAVLGDMFELGPLAPALHAGVGDYLGKAGIDCLVAVGELAEHIAQGARNSGVPLLDLKDLKARIEPGAIIREKVEIGEGAVIMMGAILNIGAVVGKRTMIDMGAVLGGRATVGDDCHIGAGAVLAGVVEPASATPVVVEDGVLVGANAVVIEGVRIGAGAVVAAGAVVTENVPPNAVVAGTPARIIKMKDARTEGKTALVDALRSL